MRVIIKIDTSPRGAVGSSAARYISQHDRNPEREAPDSRALFTPDDEGLKWYAANSYLGGKPNARPRASALHHIIISFEAKDAKELERLDDADRDRPYRGIARHTMTKLSDRLGVRGLKWVAGVHRHTTHPHIHLLLNKEAEDAKTTEKRRITRFPQELLNDRDPTTGKAVAGLINLDVSEAIDSLLGRRRGQTQTDRPGDTDQNLSTPSAQSDRILTPRPHRSTEAQNQHTWATGEKFSSEMPRNLPRQTAPPKLSRLHPHPLQGPTYPAKIMTLPDISSHSADPLPTNLEAAPDQFLIGTTAPNGQILTLPGLIEDPENAKKTVQEPIFDLVQPLRSTPSDPKTENLEYAQAPTNSTSYELPVEPPHEPELDASDDFGR